MEGIGTEKQGIQGTKTPQKQDRNPCRHCWHHVVEQAGELCQGQLQLTFLRREGWLALTSGDRRETSGEYCAPGLPNLVKTNRRMSGRCGHCTAVLACISARAVVDNCPGPRAGVGKGVELGCSTGRCYVDCGH